MVGDGPQKEMLEELVLRINVDDRVWFYGSCYDEEMIAVALQNSVLCVSPGNVGLTSIHALNYGVPVITHDNFTMQMPEAEAIHKGVTGDFFRYNDSISLAETIERWLGIMSNKQKRDKVRANAYKMIDDIYNPKNQLNAIKNTIVRKM